ncbi:hypothetical protein [Bradyrhizobium sp. USDA 336]|uniref:hypothetical protein n=1 Tax=Bradyrhizobium sp. USDA 336 TaxID=3156311 RepID=UPI00383866DA
MAETNSAGQQDIERTKDLDLISCALRFHAANVETKRTTQGLKTEGSPALTLPRTQIALASRNSDETLWNAMRVTRAMDFGFLTTYVLLSASTMRVAKGAIEVMFRRRDKKSQDDCAAPSKSSSDLRCKKTKQSTMTKARAAAAVRLAMKQYQPTTLIRMPPPKTRLMCFRRPSRKLMITIQRDCSVTS